MSRRLRLLLLCLMALALPLQGYAAATLPYCDHAASGTMQHMAGHDHRAMLARQHAGHATSEKSGCCGGATCCVGLALAAALPVLPVPLVRVATLRVADDDPPAGTPPAVLERPPRRAL